MGTLAGVLGYLEKTASARLACFSSLARDMQDGIGVVGVHLVQTLDGFGGG
jgi:hypothetical protein